MRADIPAVAGGDAAAAGSVQCRHQPSVNADAATASIRIEETCLCMYEYHGEGAGLTNGLAVQLYTCKGTSNQQWEARLRRELVADPRQGHKLLPQLQKADRRRGPKAHRLDATAASLWKIEPA
ncbi:hypothetical protein DFJ73DRAFT_774566 [Zopfochytrium polystomum]|nr:hypothetical protein DFJ73DRAFT_774566 [Zopfochytrium polystomum]